MGFKKKKFEKDDGYRGIWYFNQLSNDEYIYKYSGGLGTYCAKHIPLAYYSKEVNKTFFCYGGTRKDKNELLHMVSFYDHTTKTVPKPTILLNKKTKDAHDNPTIMLDDRGYIWIFSSSHGISRPSYIHRSRDPYSIESFVRIKKTNFSYPQCWFVQNKGFLFLHTAYLHNQRTLCFQTSLDGKKWSKKTQIAHIAKGHYQISAQFEEKIVTAFNYHPKNGLNYRTNLYLIQTEDFGKTWKTIQNEFIQLPILTVQNPALVHDYENEKLLVYLKDISFDKKGNPIILYLTSPGFESGPKNSPRSWVTAHWNGTKWNIETQITSDSNYDTGSIYLDHSPNWKIIGPSEIGPQPYNPGGEVAMWSSNDEGKSWKKEVNITNNSIYNHTYVRRPCHAHEEFYAFWADGHAREPSPSRLYFSDYQGNCYQLPPIMQKEQEKPILIKKTGRTNL